jgi:hypothetical protein
MMSKAGGAEGEFTIVTFSVSCRSWGDDDYLLSSGASQVFAYYFPVIFASCRVPNMYVL